MIQGCLLTEAKFNQTLFSLRFLRLIFQLAGLFGPDTEKVIITARLRLHRKPCSSVTDIHSCIRRTAGVKWKRFK